VAHIKLCYSRAFIIRAFLLQTHEVLFDAHTTPSRLSERSVNARFSTMTSHYLFEARA